MLFIASKVVGFITVPSNAIALLGLAGLLLLLLNQKRSAVSTLASAFILLVILGFSPAANVMLLVLSERFPAWQDDGRAPDGIIVLGGGLDPDLTTARRSPETTDAGERVLAMLIWRGAIRRRGSSIRAAAEICSGAARPKRRWRDGSSRISASPTAAWCWRTNPGPRPRTPR
ncbi:MAG: hypothetical protein JWQ82_1811 [Tardiphaga sp.]|nr:hypothetical protein [Tardiphaga sp.]